MRVSYDRLILDSCWRAVPRSAVPWLRWVTMLGGHEAVCPVLIAAGSARAIGHRRPAAAAEPLLWLAGTAIARRAVAELINRPRPDRRRWRTTATGPSCPSRHATIAVVGWGLTAELLGIPSRRRPWLVAPVAATVGASRVALGVHWPSDVLAGWAFGAAVLGLRRTIGHLPDRVGGCRAGR